ncbi:MAG: hypothetical protein M3Y06_10515 [Actinomycetota bacterium]|nr:hypothetical protein [Actinomycetota bacterium]
MDDATSVLFDLPGFAVIEGVELDDEARRTVIMQVASERRYRCPEPSCGLKVFVERSDQIWPATGAELSPLRQPFAQLSGVPAAAWSSSAPMHTE